MITNVLAFFGALTVLEWILAGVGLIFLLGSILASSHRTSTSLVLLAISFGLFGYMQADAVSTYYKAHGALYAIVVPVAYYLAIGAVIALIDWVFYCLNVKKNYRDLVVEGHQSGMFAAFVRDAKETLQKYNSNYSVDSLTDELMRRIFQGHIVSRARREIFGKNYVMAHADFSALDRFRDTAPVDILAKSEAYLALVFPPRALNAKGMITGSFLGWPITVLSLVLNRVLTVVADQLFQWGRKVIDFISRLSFGSTDVQV